MARAIVGPWTRAASEDDGRGTRRGSVGPERVLEWAEPELWEKIG